MKKLLLIFVLTMISLGGYSQPEKQDFSKDYYLQKSKNQRTAGWVLLGAGAGIGIIGAIVSAEALTEDWFFGDSKKSDTGLIIGAVGAASSLASIPFFISASKNSRKAAQLSLESQRYIIPGKEISGVQPALSLKIEW
ncbi:MAG: hypothetical protein ABJ092_08790 [Gillisia sp.]